MSEVSDLLRAYQDHVSVRWDPGAAGSQRVWFAVYSPHQERRIRLRLTEFEGATRQARHGWILCDLEPLFARWLNTLDYRDAYFQDPQYLSELFPDFSQFIARHVTEVLESNEADADTVVALIGAGSLFGLASVSALVNAVADHIRGRLLVFFPGSYSGSTYHLLNARDGWNYLAVPITARQEGS